MTGIDSHTAHLSPDDLASFLDGRLGEAERTAAVAHLADCAECRRELVEARRAVSSRRSGARVATTVALAAAASIVLIFSPQLTRRPLPTDPLRGGPEEPLTAHGPEGTLTDRPVELVWSFAGSGAVYSLVLTESDGTTVWRASTEDTAVALPDSVMLDGSAAYRWWVDALLPDGTTRSTSVQEFRTPP